MHKKYIKRSYTERETLFHVRLSSAMYQSNVKYKIQVDKAGNLAHCLLRAMNCLRKMFGVLLHDIDVC